MAIRLYNDATKQEDASKKSFNLFKTHTSTPVSSESSVTTYASQEKSERSCSASTSSIAIESPPTKKQKFDDSAESTRTSSIDTKLDMILKLTKETHATVHSQVQDKSKYCHHHNQFPRKNSIIR